MKQKFLILFFPFILFLCTIYVTWTYGFHFPFWDQWDLIYTMEKSQNGELGFKDVFIQHNEHRLFFPRIIMLTMAYFTNWNISYEIALNLILGFITFIVIFNELKKVFDGSSLLLKMVGIGSISLLFLSMSHFENWTWGWQIQIFLNILMVFLSLSWLNKSEYKNKYFIFSILAGIIATFSFGNGMALWVMGILMIITFQNISTKKKWAYLSIWIFTFLFVFFLYIWGFQMSNHTKINRFTFDFLQKYISFVVGCLGMIARLHSDKIGFGIVGILIYLIATIYFFNKKILFSPNIRLYLFLSFYSIVSAMITGLNRADFGEGNNILTAGVYHVAPRYMTIISFFWLYILVFIITLFLRNPISFTTKKVITKKIIVLNVFSTILFLSVNIMFFKNHNNGISDAKEMHRRTLLGSKEIKKINFDEKTLKSVYGGDKKRFIILQKILNDKKLTIFNTQIK